MAVGAQDIICSISKGGQCILDSLKYFKNASGSLSAAVAIAASRCNSFLKQ